MSDILRIEAELSNLKAYYNQTSLECNKKLVEAAKSGDNELFIAVSNQNHTLLESIKDKIDDLQQRLDDLFCDGDSDDEESYDDIEE